MVTLSVDLMQKKCVFLRNGASNTRFYSAGHVGSAKSTMK